MSRIISVVISKQQSTPLVYSDLISPAVSLYPLTSVLKRNRFLLSWSFTLVNLKDSKLSGKPGNNYYFNSCGNNCYSSKAALTVLLATPATGAPDQSTVPAPAFPSQRALIRGLVKASYLPVQGPLHQAPGV